MAISGASNVAIVNEARWSGSAAPSDETEGGNITYANVTGTVLTDKWASYFGNVSGNITLDDNGANASVYSWSWALATGGEICLSTASAYDFSTPTVATGANVDTAWAFSGADADSGANTFAGACTLDFAQGSVVGTQYIDIKGASTYNSCVIYDGAGAAETDYAFCTALADGLNYNSSTVHYEVMVPTTVGNVLETYYFYVELE